MIFQLSSFWSTHFFAFHFIGPRLSAHRRFRVFSFPRLIIEFRSSDGFSALLWTCLKFIHATQCYRTSCCWHILLWFLSNWLGSQTSFFKSLLCCPSAFGLKLDCQLFGKKWFQEALSDLLIHVKFNVKILFPPCYYVLMIVKSICVEFSIEAWELQFNCAQVILH